MSAKKAELLKSFPMEFRDLVILHHLTVKELSVLRAAIDNYFCRIIRTELQIQERLR